MAASDPNTPCFWTINKVRSVKAPKVSLNPTSPAQDHHHQNPTIPQSCSPYWTRVNFNGLDLMAQQHWLVLLTLWCWSLKQPSEDTTPLGALDLMCDWGTLQPPSSYNCIYAESNSIPPVRRKDCARCSSDTALGTRVRRREKEESASHRQATSLS